MELAATSDALVAAIGVGGVLLGTAVGGFTTYMIERRREWSQSEREHQAEIRLTRGIARVWSKKLGDFYVLVDDHSPPQAGSCWWKEENDVNPEIDVEDMKRVAAAVSSEQWSEQWRAIDYALTHVREARAARDYALRVAGDKGIGESPQISPKGIATLRCAMEKVECAIEGLARLSCDKYPPDWLEPRIKRSKEPGHWRAESE
jgi:hypothetical protein